MKAKNNTANFRDRLKTAADEAKDASCAETLDCIDATSCITSGNNSSLAVKWPRKEYNKNIACPDYTAPRALGKLDAMVKQFEALIEEMSEHKAEGSTAGWTEKLLDSNSAATAHMQGYSMSVH